MEKVTIEAPTAEQIARLIERVTSVTYVEHITSETRSGLRYYERKFGYRNQNARTQLQREFDAGRVKELTAYDNRYTIRSQRYEITFKSLPVDHLLNGEPEAAAPTEDSIRTEQVLTGLLRDIGETFRPQLEADFTANVNCSIGHLRSHDGWYRLPRRPERMETRSDYLAYQHRLERATRLFDKYMQSERLDGRELVYKPVDDFNDRVQRNAVEYATSVIDAFLNKQVGKYNAIIHAKGLSAEFSVNGTVMLNAIRISFPDGSSLRIQNSIVHNWSGQGTPYVQFPTTFHDVVLADGSRLKAPSEKKVKAAFTRTAA